MDRYWLTDELSTSLRLALALIVQAQRIFVDRLASIVETRLQTHQKLGLIHQDSCQILQDYRLVKRM